MLRRVTLVRTDVTEEHIASIITVTKIDELGTTLAVTSNRITLIFLRSMRQLLVTANVVPSTPIYVTLMMKAIRSSETSAHTRVSRRNIPEEGIPQNIISFFILVQLCSCSQYISTQDFKYRTVNTT
jgi:hypothetical protein